MTQSLIQCNTIANPVGRPLVSLIAVGPPWDWPAGIFRLTNFPLAVFFREVVGSVPATDQWQRQPHSAARGYDEPTFLPEKAKGCRTPLLQSRAAATLSGNSAAHRGLSGQRASIRSRVTLYVPVETACISTRWYKANGLPSCSECHPRNARSIGLAIAYRASNQTKPVQPGLCQGKGVSSWW